jgi:hypothetical protein
VIRAEWMKLRRSFVLWLLTLSAAFVPSILFVARLSRPAALRAANFWETNWKNSWEAVAILLLPLFVMLLVSLVVQLETRNNTWKQLHASPQPMMGIFAAKLLVLLTLLAGFFLFANAGVYLAAVLPARILRSTLPPAQLFIGRSFGFFVDALPIVALQYLLSLHVKNFVVPLGIGVALWLAAIGGLSWKYIHFIPYGYAAMDFLTLSGARSFPSHGLLAVAVFAAICAVNAVLYLRKEDRG